MVAIITIIGWTYKLNRDLKTDLQNEMTKNKNEMIGYFNAHIHESDTGEVLLRAIANR